MDEKSLSERHILGVGQRRTASPLKQRLWVAFLTILCVATLAIQWGSSQRRSPPRYVSYAGEHITWEQCGDLNGRALECSSIDVPIDQFDVNNSGGKSFNIPLIRLRGKNATQNLILNPGGPGGSGLEFMYRRGQQLNAIVGEGFHLLSFDPRGVNTSEPLASCYPDSETRRELSRVKSNSLEHDSSEVYAWTQNFVKACADVMGEYGKYINTPQTAADMNSILDAVGQEYMAYWGFSYGTLLGQTYATLFPERSNRVIIDGVVNQFEWYEKNFYEESLFDTENVLHGFFNECVKAGPNNCSLSSLARSAEELQDLVLTFMEKLREQPLSSYINSTVYGLLDHRNLWFGGVFPALYKPLAWYDLANHLHRLLEGDTTDAFMAYGRREPWNIRGDSTQFVCHNDGAAGQNHWPQDRQSLLDKLIPFFNQSLFGEHDLKAYYAKQQWAIPKTHQYVPRRGVETVHPILILSTTYDPVCPLKSAHSANDAFEGSRIVEVKGYGHCSVSLTSLCAVEHVRAFLYEGKLPQTHTRCEADSPYFIKPSDDHDSVLTRTFGSPEQEMIHLAQLALARDTEWPAWK